MLQNAARGVVPTKGPYIDADLHKCVHTYAHLDNGFYKFEEIKMHRYDTDLEYLLRARSIVQIAAVAGVIPACHQHPHRFLRCVTATASGATILCSILCMSPLYRMKGNAVKQPTWIPEERRK